MDCHPNTESLNSQYMVLHPISHGAFGSVQLAYHRLTGILVAIKVMEYLKKDLRFIVSEMGALKRLHHPNIIRLFQVLVTPERICFITEYVPGRDLLQHVMQLGRLKEEEAQNIFVQILSALRHCHRLDIVHRDLKPENILLDQEGNVKLTGFGLATRYRAGTLLQGQCGTKIFNAPEQVLRMGYNGKKTDVWSLGVLLYFITSGKHPFQGNTMEEIELNMVMSRYDVPAHFSGRLENLIHQMLTVAPERRPSVDDFQEHPWVENIPRVKNIPRDTVIDPHVLDTLSDLGFNKNDVLESLQEKKYDELMGTYLLIREQARKGLPLELGCTTSVKPVDAGVAPPPTPVLPYTALPLTRRASEPTFGLLHTQPSQQHLPVGPAAPGQKVARSASMPACFPQKSPTCSSASLTTVEASPSVCSSISAEETIPSPETDSEMENAQNPQNIGCFRRLCKTIRACLSRLCCCSGDPNTHVQRRFNNKVAPLKETG